MTAFPLAVEALKLIEEFEGYLRLLGDGTDRVKPYLCPANVPTIGIGTTRYPDGRRVTMQDPVIDHNTAYAYLASELREDAAGFDKLTTRKLHPFSRGALISFCYNCGVGAYRGSTLRRKVNEGEWEDVPAQLMKWRMGGGRVLKGLERRRAAEGKLFIRGVNDRTIDSTAVEVPSLPAPAPAPVEKPEIVPVTPGSRTMWDRVRDVLHWIWN